MRFILALCVAVSLCACGDGNHRARSVEEIRSAEAQALRDWNARDVNRVVERYADQAMVKFVPSRAMIGRQAIRSGTAPFLADPNFQISFGGEDVRVRQSGKLGSTSGSYSVRYTDPATGKAALESGTYVTVWERQKDGQWRVVEDITSANPTK